MRVVLIEVYPDRCRCSMTSPYLEKLLTFGPTISIFIVMVVLIKAISMFSAKRRLAVDYRRTLLPQFLLAATGFMGVLFIVMALPVTDTTRGQVLGLIGVVFTGIIAFSSTTFVTNAFAGLMLRLIRNYKAGDFICINDLFGRITERGLFHTEIQTEERDLTTLPNLYLITNPMTVVRSSGTIVSASLSLGYDESHHKVEPLLIEAATHVGLTEPFVQVMELGDFSVSYKISGFLAETKQLLAMRSNLKRAILDVLHAAGVEIVSPNFMNQRVLSSNVAVIPESAGVSKGPGRDPAALPEDLIFDKAEIAEEKANWEAKLAELGAKRDALKKDKSEVDAEVLRKIEAAMEKIERRIKKADTLLNADEESPKGKKL